jgi:acylphosphatase
MNKYEVELNFPYTCYTSSYLYSKEVYVKNADDGDVKIIVETKHNSKYLENECDVDIKRVVCKL